MSQAEADGALQAVLVPAEPAITVAEIGWNPAEQVVTADDEWVPKSSKKKTARKRTRDITTQRSVFESHRYIKDGAPDVDLLERCKPKEILPRTRISPLFSLPMRACTISQTCA